MVQRNQFSRYLASKLRIVCCNSIDLWCNHSRFTGLSYFYEASLSTNLKKRQHAEVSAADIAGDLDWKVCLAPIGCVQGGIFFLFYIERERVKDWQNCDHSWDEMGNPILRHTQLAKTQNHLSTKWMA